jgi:TonB family protein
LAGAPVPAVLRAGIDVPEPERTRNVPFRFPIIALREGITGFVAVEVVVDGRGRVKAAKVVRSVPQLDQAALSAVRRWQFAPTQKDGKPVDVVALLVANFTARTSPQVPDDLEFAAFYFFDQSAVDAVQQWQYTPSLLDGKPVEVLMTVTVTYSVSRRPERFGHARTPESPEPRAAARHPGTRHPWNLLAFGASFVLLSQGSFGSWDTLSRPASR